MAESDVRVPAGWYPDPLGLPQLRWWDNHSWTEYTSDARQPMMPQETITQQARLAYADDDEELTRRERREREREAEAVQPEADASGVRVETEQAKPAAETLLSLEAPVKEDVVVEELSPAAMFADITPEDAPTTPAYNLDSRFDDLLGAPQGPVSAFQHVSESTAAFVPEPTFRPEAMFQADPFAETPVQAAPAAVDRSVSTGAAWAIAFMPAFMLLAGMFFLLGSTTSGGAATAVAVTLLAIPYFATVLLAWVDRNQLIRRGHAHTAHWLLAFASAPVYLVARFAAVVRTSGRGFGPLVSWVGLSALTAAAIVAVPGLIIALSPAQFSEEAASGIEQQAAAFGAEIEVACPEFPPTIVGQSMECLANNAGDPIRWGVDVSLQREAGWISWRVDDWGIFNIGS